MDIGVHIYESTSEMLYTMTFPPALLDKIKSCQEKVMSLNKDQLTREEKESQKDDKGILQFSSKIWIPHVTEFQKEILYDAYNQLLLYSS